MAVRIESTGSCLVKREKSFQQFSVNLMSESIKTDYETGVSTAAKKNFENLPIVDAGSSYPNVYFEKFQILVFKLTIEKKI